MVEVLGQGEARLIALDWGTSSARAWLLGAGGEILERQAGAYGILAAGVGFRDTLEALCGAWMKRWPAVPLIAAGMIGSRQGWAEAPYVPTPAGARGLAAQLLPPGPDRPIHIVPGVSQSLPADVMRGEETQILGALISAHSAGAEDGGQRVCVLPGTHSKWVRVVDGRIERFHTAMTGELFAILKAHSILGRSLPEDAVHSPEAFAAGVRDGLSLESRPGGLLAALFGLRAAWLLGQLPTGDQADRLSGLLIGAELGAMSSHFDLAGQPVVLIGDEVLTRRYQLAFSCAGLRADPAVPDAAARGLWALAAASGLCA